LKRTARDGTTPSGGSISSEAMPLRTRKTRITKMKTRDITLSRARRCARLHYFCGDFPIIHGVLAIGMPAAEACTFASACVPCGARVGMVRHELELLASARHRGLGTMKPSSPSAMMSSARVGVAITGQRQAIACPAQAPVLLRRSAAPDVAAASRFSVRLRNGPDGARVFGPELPLMQHFKDGGRNCADECQAFGRMLDLSKPARDTGRPCANRNSRRTERRSVPRPARRLVRTGEVDAIGSLRSFSGATPSLRNVR